MEKKLANSISNPIFLSVIISTYNEERYISASIKSILEQTYPYFELIIVNDGSTDNTLEIIKSFNDKRIVIVDKPNSGLPDSLNIGIKKSKYDWIARMDGDDIALPTRFETQVKYISDSVGVIGGQFRTINENGEYLDNDISSKPLTSFKSKLYTIIGWNPLAHPTALIRKSILVQSGGYDINFKASQDIDLWCRLSSKGKIINTREEVLLYRKHPNNISSQKSDRQRCLSFLAFVKQGLKINKALSIEEFDRLIHRPIVTRSIMKNKLLTDYLYSGCLGKRNFKMYTYYIWRILLFVKLRVAKTKIKKKIFCDNAL